MQAHSLSLHRSDTSWLAGSEAPAVGPALRKRPSTSLGLNKRGVCSANQQLQRNLKPIINVKVLVHLGYKSLEILVIEDVQGMFKQEII